LITFFYSVDCWEKRDLKKAAGKKGKERLNEDLRKRDGARATRKERQQK
jgi:hypothetical protein